MGSSARLRGDILYVRCVVLPQDSADGAPYHKGGHMELSHKEGYLCGDLSTEGKQPSSCSVGSYRDGEKQVQYVLCSVSVEA